MSKIVRIWLVIVGFVLGVSPLAADTNKVSLGEVAEHAVQQSKLTLPGSKPFHLKAAIIETTNPSSEYQAKVEEYWMSPQKWRRTIESPDFSQTLIVNGNQVSEKDTGDYFPWWLNDLVTAMLNPVPMLDQIKQINLQISKPRGTQDSNTCADFRTKIDRWIFCFEGSHGLVVSVFARGFDAEFKDIKDFADKRVARLILIDPEPGTTIQARITELTEFRQGDEALFAIQKATPPQEQIKAVQVDEATVRGLALGSTEITWPSVGGGPTTGRCAVYVSADRTGRIREVWPQGCDNPGLQDPLREMVKKWQLKPAAQNGAPVQIEGLVTFNFGTEAVNDPTPPKVNDPRIFRTALPFIPPRCIKFVKPDCSVGQACHGIHGDVVVVVTVLENGTAGEVTPRSGDPRLYDDATNAAKECRFQPGTIHGSLAIMNFDLKYEF